MNNKTPDTSWILTDDDSYQYLRYAPERGERTWECVQIISWSEVNLVSHATIDIDEYSQEEKNTTLRLYDYDETVSDQILAECLFEVYCFEFCDGPDYATFEEAKQAVMKIIERQP